MNSKEIIREIIQHIHLAQEEGVIIEEIFTHSSPDIVQHEFLFFIKPEITIDDESVNLQAILEMMFSKFDQFGLWVKDIRIMGARYLEQYNIIAQHYGVINSLSRKPLDYFSTGTHAKFREIYGNSPNEVTVLGGLEFLQHFPDFTPRTLDQLWKNSKTEKLAGGNYCARITMEGKEIYLINGFHPKQLIHFTEKGRSIVAFTLTGNLDWSTARNNFIGKTNPEEALPGSLRNELLQNRGLFGCQEVSSSQNGFHLSAGPVEGLVELIRYCSDYAEKKIKTVDDFVFGRQLKQVFNDAEIRSICNNHMVTHQDKKISIFDLTEEKNSQTALELLKESKF